MACSTKASWWNLVLALLLGGSGAVACVRPSHGAPRLYSVPLHPQTDAVPQTVDVRLLPALVRVATRAHARSLHALVPMPTSRLLPSVSLTQLGPTFPPPPVGRPAMPSAPTFELRTRTRW